jgi:hypothetical protein
MSHVYAVSVLQALSFSKTKAVGGFNDGGSLWYKITNNTTLTFKSASSGHLINVIIGYS